MKIQKSVELFQQAQTLLPGGVDSPVRAFRAVGGQPLFIKKGSGPYLQDVDDNRYIDYVLSWGPLILGHAHPQVVEAVKQAAEMGTSYGAPSPLELELAQQVQRFMPNIEMLRFVNSGTEATMTALRLARAYTKRDKIIKFEGCYHGHADLLLVQAGSGVATLGLPDSPGVPPATVQDTLVARYNDLGSVAELFAAYTDEIAAVIIEPVAGNMGVVVPEAGFLEGLRALSQNHGALLIFDEVMTGFRVHPSGAQALYNIQPDLTTLGKVIGGGLPVGAYGGKRDVMKLIAPAGPVYQAGTLRESSGDGGWDRDLAALDEPGIWESLENSSQKLAAGIGKAADDAGVSVWQNRVGTMFATFFTENPVKDWPSAKESDTENFSRFFQGMLERGVYLAPSQFEAGFMSTAHGEAEIDATIQAAVETFRSW